MMTATFVDVMLIDLATFSFLLTIIPGLAWKVGLAVAAGDAAAGAAVAGSSRSGCGAASRRSEACLCFAALAGCRSRCRPTARTSSDPHQYVSKFARSGAVAAVDLMTRGVLEADAAVAGPAEPRRRRRRCDAGRQAAAHRHGVRRIELRRHHDAGRQGSAGLPRALPLVRRQDARVRGRGRRRPELVHRIQRAHRAFGALLRPLRRIRSPGSPPAGSSAACRTRCDTAATRPTASIPGSGPLSAPAASRPRPASSISSTPRQLRHRSGRHRQLLLRSCRAGDRAGARQRSGLRLRLSRGQPLSRGTTAIVPTCSPDWVDPGNSVRDRRISAPPGDERARLRAVPASASRANFPASSS